jgi:hypothetical protein
VADKRQHGVQIDMAGVCNDLQALMRDVVEQMNHIAEIKRRTGGLYFQRERLNKIVIKKQSLPVIYVTLTCGNDVVDVHYRILVNGPNVEGQERRETLSFEIDQTGALQFLNQEGKSLTIERVVFYILRPFLRPQLLIPEW